MRKVKKKLKGMTLIEMIISIAIFAMLGAVIILASNSIAAHIKDAKTLNQKVAVQGPIAEVQRDIPEKLINNSVTITVKDADDASASPAVLSGKLYDTAEIERITDGSGQPVTDANGNFQFTTVDNSSLNGGLNFKYIAEVTYETQPTTTATTAATT